MRRLLVLLLIGCAPPPTAAGPMTFDEYVTRATAASCASFERCGDAREFATTFRTEVTDCAAQLADYERSAIYGPLRAALDRGTLIFHGEDADACFAALAASPCDASGTPVACTDLFEPTVPDDGVCASWLECLSGGRCFYAGTCGTCQPMRGAMGCTSSAGCEPGSFCTAGACRARADVGEACDATLVDACRDGLDCNGGVCAARVRGEGAHCANSYECMPGTQCVGATCAPLFPGTCVRQSDCPTDMYCAIENMQSPHSCMPYPGLGEICEGACVTGAFCSIGASSGVPRCVAPDGSNGSPCTADSDCFTHHCVAGACAFVPGCVP